MNIGPGNVQELTSEEDYMKMGGDRVSVLFRDWVGCNFFLLKISFARHCLDVGVGALHSRCKCPRFFGTRFAYFLYSTDCSWIITSVPSSA